MAHTILEELLQIKDGLPKKQQKLCQYLLANYEQVGVMTVAELAAAADVGTTTVMRLVQLLGCDSFGMFKKEFLNAALMNTTTSYRSLKETFTSLPETESRDTLRSVVADGIRVLENLETPANVEQFERSIQMLTSARNIFTLGKRSSRPMALYFESAVNCFYPRVHQLSENSDYFYDRIVLNATAEDVVLVISIWPCTKRTIQMAEFCHKQGIPVILVTNTSVNPIMKFAKAVIDTNSVNHSSGDTGIMAVLEAMIAELGRRVAPVSTENIERVEQLLGEHKIVLREY